eukprot:TRINITY_DN37109_c0_g1_i1.p1 TRINITY_DN37109_c0_g1~~TRINITY_DN37109_c0_g1_i1.p1  ORF type:complete len:473 (+),score=113.53 TRINITY_DN37109_c0_g1_i1:213-1631(+)
MMQRSPVRAHKSQVLPKRAPHARGGSPTRLAAPTLGRTHNAPISPATTQHPKPGDGADHLVAALEREVERRREAKEHPASRPMAVPSRKSKCVLPAVGLEPDDLEIVVPAERPAERGGVDETSKMRGLLHKAMLALAESESQRGLAEQQRDEAQQMLVDELETKSMLVSQQERAAAMGAPSPKQDEIGPSIHEAKLVVDKAKQILQKVLTTSMKHDNQRGCWVLLRPKDPSQLPPTIAAVIKESTRVYSSAKSRRQYTAIKACVQAGDLMVGLDGLMASLNAKMAGSGAQGSFTVNEVSTFLGSTGFCEFAEWLLQGRHRNFKRHDVSHSGRLTADTMRNALADYLSSLGSLLTPFAPNIPNGSVDAELGQELEELDASVSALYAQTHTSPLIIQHRAPAAQGSEQSDFACAELVAEFGHLEQIAGAGAERSGKLCGELQSLRKKCKQSGHEIVRLKAVSYTHLTLPTKRIV